MNQRRCVGCYSRARPRELVVFPLGLLPGPRFADQSPILIFTPTQLRIGSLLLELEGKTMLWIRYVYMATSSYNGFIIYELLNRFTFTV
jgi:hypothetical protein